MKDRSDIGKRPEIPSCLSWLFPYKFKKLPLSTQNPAAYYLLQNKISLTFINWFFQGMMGMDAADLIGKIIFDVFFCAVFLIVFNSVDLYSLLAAFALSHTLNWVLNAHFWVFGRFLGITRTDQDRFLLYLKEIENRLNNDHSVASVIVIGSFSRHEGFKSTSDVDIMFIRKEGFLNAVRAILVTMRERALAFLKKFPLDLQLYDSMDSMKKHRKDEVPVILKDNGTAGNWYRKDGRSTETLDDLTRD